MIQSTKNDHYWSFWCRWWSNHQDQDLCWWNRAVEAVEASEVAEATEVNEAADVSKACKITTEDFRVILVLEFNNLGTQITKAIIIQVGSIRKWAPALPSDFVNILQRLRVKISLFPFCLQTWRNTSPLPPATLGKLW